MEHGERIFKKFVVNNGQSTCEKPVRVCVLHGEIDEFSFHLHAVCDRQPKPRHGAFTEAPKYFKKAA